MTAPTLDRPGTPPPGSAASTPKPRRMIDVVLTAGGPSLTAVLIVAGSLLLWAHGFAAIGAFVAAGLMLVLSTLSVLHLRRRHTAATIG